MKMKGLIDKIPVVVSCVLLNHPFIRLTGDIEREIQESLLTPYAFGGNMKNIRKEFLNFPFVKGDSTLNLDEVPKVMLKISKI